jgi:hypothetical protein
MGGGLQSTTHIAHRALLGLALTFASSAAVTVKTALELRAAVASGTSETIFLSDDIHLGGRPLSILDRGANLTLDGQNHEISGGGESRVVYINQTQDSVVVKLTRLLILDGAASSEDGGGILQDDGNTILESVLFQNCSTEANGGGILLRNGTMALETCSFIGCASGWGGGVNIWDGSMELRGVSFSGCSGTNAGNEVYDFPGPLTCVAGCPELGTYLPGGECAEPASTDCQTFDETLSEWVACPEPCSASCTTCAVCPADYYNGEPGGLGECKACPGGLHTNGTTPADHDSVDDCK